MVAVSYTEDGIRLLNYVPAERLDLFVFELMLAHNVTSIKVWEPR
jgi:hypothetical protein